MQRNATTVLVVLLLHALTFLSVSLHVFAQNCRKINSCKCEMDDGSGIINLRSLAHPGNLPKWTLGGGDGWMYKYNPCLGYAMGVYEDLAVGQASTSGSTFDLGVQSSASFNVTKEGDLSIKYTAKDELRSARVILRCDQETRYDKLDFIGEIRITEYDFVLTSPCACPGYCDNFGLYEEIAQNMSGYWENRYGGKREHKGSTPQQASSEFPWSNIGTLLSGLLLHDILLVVLIASCLVIYRYLRTFRKNSISKESSMEFESVSQQILMAKEEEA